MISTLPSSRPSVKPDILLVGHGKMGGALSARWQDTCNLTIVTRTEKKIPFKPHAIVFAVKPQVLGEVIGDYKSFDSLFISIAAGKTISFLEQHLGDRAKIVRAMPNTPAAVGKGITVAVANKNAGAPEQALATTLLSAIGDVLWTKDEAQMDAVTALSGSGPAYVFLLIETLAQSGVKLGLSPEMAMKLARQTVIGSAALAEAVPAIPASDLRHNVTSPGGTTQAALDVLTKEIQPLFDRALEAAAKRAKELSN